MCDFKELFPPEMVKVRPVVIVPRQSLINGNGCVLVVPLRSSPPTRPRGHHVHLPTVRMPWAEGEGETWAKCDMVYAVSRDRLVFVHRNGFVIKMRLADEDLERVRMGVVHTLFGQYLRR